MGKDISLVEELESQWLFRKCILQVKLYQGTDSSQ